MHCIASVDISQYQRLYTKLLRVPVFLHRKSQRQRGVVIVLRVLCFGTSPQACITGRLSIIHGKHLPDNMITDEPFTLVQKFGNNSFYGEQTVSRCGEIIMMTLLEVQCGCLAGVHCSLLCLQVRPVHCPCSISNPLRCACSLSFMCSTRLKSSGVSVASLLPYTAACMHSLTRSQLGQLEPQAKPLLLAAATPF